MWLEARFFSPAEAAQILILELANNIVLWRHPLQPAFSFCRFKARLMALEHREVPEGVKRTRLPSATA